MVEMLNSTFAGLDGALLGAMHSLAQSAGSFFTPLFKVITLLGEKGLIFFALSVVLMLFAKTRKLGICMFGAVACGAIITNLVLKDVIARPRPFLTEEYAEFWQFVGSPKEDGFSFPSGHMTAITAAMTALFILCNKKWSWVGFVGVIVMGLSRIYLVAHYPSDVLAGIIVGALSALIAWAITVGIYKLLKKHENNKFCTFVLNFDLIKAFKKKDGKAKSEETNKAENVIETDTAKVESGNDIQQK